MKNNWKKVKLGRVAKVISGYAFKKNDFGNIGTPVVKIKNIRKGFLDMSETDYVNDIFLDKVDEKFHVEKDDILISLTGSHMTQPNSVVGRIAIARNEEKYLLNQRAGKIITFNNKVYPRFLFYLISQEHYLFKIASMAHGAASQANVSPTQVESIDILLPENKIQQKIASVLSVYDDLIEINNRRIKILEEMVQAIYEEWFVNFKFPGSPYAKASADKHEKVKIKNGIPEGWEKRKVEDVVKRVQSGKKYDNKSAQKTGKIPILDQGRSGIIGYHNDEPGVMASEEDPIIVFANHTCYQNLTMYPFSAIQNVLPFYPNDENYRNIFWLHFATKDLIEFNDYKGHWPEFSAKRLLLPPTDICEKFGNLIKPMMIFKFKLENTNNNLRKTRDLLLPKLISGEIEV